jgi:hypothetical protein
MNWRATAILMSTIIVSAESGLPEPTVMPLFLPNQDQPAFVVQCASSMSRKFAWFILDSAIRVDGQLHETSFMGSYVNFDVPPGTTFTQIVLLGRYRDDLTLADDPLQYAPYRGATAWHLALNRGKHAISIRCGEQWSQEVPFLWAGS